MPTSGQRRRKGPHPEEPTLRRGGKPRDVSKASVVLFHGPGGKRGPACAAPESTGISTSLSANRAWVGAPSAPHHSPRNKRPGKPSSIEAILHLEPLSHQEQQRPGLWGGDRQDLPCQFLHFLCGKVAKGFTNVIPSAGTRAKRPQRPDVALKHVQMFPPSPRAGSGASRTWAPFIPR